MRLFTILCLLGATSTNLPAIEILWVTGGDTTSPYYSFQGPNNTPIDITTFSFHRGETYVFQALGVLPAHPFMIGQSNGDTTSSLVGVSGGGDPSPLEWQNGNLSITIPTNYNGDLVYFSTNDSSVHYHLKIVNPPGSNYQSSGGGYQTHGGGYQSGGSGYQSGGGGYQSQGSSYLPVYALNVSHLTSLSVNVNQAFDGNYSFFNDTSSSGSPEIRIKLMLHSSGQFQPDTSLGYYVAKPDLFPAVPDIYDYLNSINLSPVNGYTPPLVYYQGPGSGYQSGGGGYQTGGNGYQTGGGGYQTGGNGYQTGGGGYQTGGGGYQTGGGSYQISGGGYQTGGGGYQTGGGGYQTGGGSYQTSGGGYQTGGGGYQTGGNGYQTGGGGFQTGGNGYQTGGGSYQTGDGGYQTGGNGYQTGGGSYQTGDGGYQTGGNGYQTGGGGHQSGGGGYQTAGGGYQTPGTGYQSQRPGYQMGYVKTIGHQLGQSAMILSGQLFDVNESEWHPIQVGFLVSTNMQIALNDPLTHNVSAQRQNSGTFSSSFETSSHQVLYFRAYAQRQDQTILGNIRKITLEGNPQQSGKPIARALSLLAEDSVPLEGGWFQNSWFGLYRSFDNGWIYHSHHGWLYLIADDTQGIWAWSEERGWAWSTKDLYPFLYQWNLQNWVYVFPVKDGQVHYFNYSTNSIETASPINASAGRTGSVDPGAMQPGSSGLR